MKLFINILANDNCEIDFIDTDFRNAHGRIEQRKYYISYNASINRWKNLVAV